MRKQSSKNFPRRLRTDSNQPSQTRQTGLAVAKAYRRRGFGKILLVAAMGKFIEVFKTAGGIGRFVDSKDQNGKRYYEQFEFVAMPSKVLESFQPVKTIQGALMLPP